MNKLQQFVASKPFGFLRETDMPELIEMDRFMPCLVRCGGCRFTCAAQDVAHLTKCVTAGGDYVRDVSMASGYEERAAKWSLPHVAASRPSRDLAVTPLPPNTGPKPDWLPFNEADCGGVFDGRQVISDADPGL